MSKVFTKAGVELINYTRYNSKDLIALMEAVETAIGAQGINCNPPGPLTLAGKKAQFEFKDYNPKHKWRRTRTWDTAANKMSFVEIRTYTATTADWGLPGGVLSVIPPGQVYADAIEELSSVVNEEACIPFAMLSVLWANVVDLYPASREGVGGTPVPTTVGDVIGKTPAAGLRVRIEANRAVKKPVSAKGLESKRKYEAKLRDMLYYGKRAADAAEHMLKDGRIAEKHGKPIGLSCGSTEELERAIALLDSCRNETIRNLNAVK